MKTVIEVPSLDDDLAFIDVRVPIKGRKALEFKVRRRDMTPFEDFKVLQWLAVELDHDKDKMAELVADPEEPTAADRAVHLLSLRPYVTDEQFKVLQSLAIGQLRYITNHINKLSAIAMGES